MFSSNVNLFFTDRAWQTYLTQTLGPALSMLNDMHVHVVFDMTNQKALCNSIDKLI